MTCEKINYTTKQNYNYLVENLENPRTSLFYRLPKIPKITTYVFNSYTYNLPKFDDSFLKLQAQKSQSYIRDTKDLSCEKAVVRRCSTK